MDIPSSLNRLFREHRGTLPDSTELLPDSGSMRKYYRLKTADYSVIGAFNPDEKENRAFTGFTRHFRGSGFKVPEILAEDLSRHIYLLEDLGDETLFMRISSLRGKNGGHELIRALYQRVVMELPRIQIEGGRGLDYSLCYPRDRFDHQSMLWDLNYFKYYFLKLAGISFDEQGLEDDFIRLIRSLEKAGAEDFMYRDFQSRNIMLRGSELYYIDYQGGRKGPLQYDLASLLWDAKADLGTELRRELLELYLKEVQNYKKVDAESFSDLYYQFVYIRIMQALGAYGYRGFYERKEHFLLSIPYAINNLRYLLEHHPLPSSMKQLVKCLYAIAGDPSLEFSFGPKEGLHLSIHSFSYKNGLPRDFSGNGGGFVFDCRSLPNPGRYDEYKSLTGRDKAVADFLEHEPAVSVFTEHCAQLVGAAVENYLERGFSHLMVSFGCTGGQHRSVWCAENLMKAMVKKFDIHVTIKHREIKDGKKEV